ncbi:hypothetical protein HDV05_007155 [Chytridiales sp. JEL 0842]|nr:hypothetical protein HDV05_007155 [Chytridiales sp. JEL 0842]
MSLSTIPVVSSSPAYPPPQHNSTPSRPVLGTIHSANATPLSAVPPSECDPESAVRAKLQDMNFQSSLSMTSFSSLDLSNDPTQQQTGSDPSTSFDAPNSSKSKRKRATPEQLRVLHAVLEKTFFPATELRNALAKQLGMTPRAVQIWFQNKRQGWKVKCKQDRQLEEIRMHGGLSLESLDGWDAAIEAMQNQKLSKLNVPFDARSGASRSGGDDNDQNDMIDEEDGEQEERMKE